MRHHKKLCSIVMLVFFATTPCFAIAPFTKVETKSKLLDMTQKDWNRLPLEVLLQLREELWEQFHEDYRGYLENPEGVDWYEGSYHRNRKDIEAISMVILEKQAEEKVREELVEKFITQVIKNRYARRKRMPFPRMPIASKRDIGPTDDRVSKQEEPDLGTTLQEILSRLESFEKILKAQNSEKGVVSYLLIERLQQIILDKTAWDAQVMQFELELPEGREYFVGLQLYIAKKLNELDEMVGAEKGTSVLSQAL